MKALKVIGRLLLGVLVLVTNLRNKSRLKKPCVEKAARKMDVQAEMIKECLVDLLTISRDVIACHSSQQGCEDGTACSELFLHTPQKG